MVMNTYEEAMERGQMKWKIQEERGWEALSLDEKAMALMWDKIRMLESKIRIADERDNLMGEKIRRLRQRLGEEAFDLELYREITDL